MLTADFVLALLSDLESDRIERTRSEKDTDKFSQAICAFANDYPHHRQPSYLIVGANDDGRLAGLCITDQLLQNLAAIRADGGILPPPEYGGVTLETLTEQSSYRNPVLAEAMKAMGYVNRFGYGVQRAQALLKANGNPAAEFEVNPHFVKVTVRSKHP
jgi:predicted HTH transcriptional regulator